MSDIFRFDTEEQTLTKEKIKLKKPSKYRVIILNDDFTPMEFVVWILQVVFHRSRAESQQIMLKAHITGKALCGVYSHDVARTKVAQVQQLAEQHGYPLHCTMEVEEGEEES
ncbi:ATP-dependent Clp protease adapter ClpS [Leptospira interrogans]|uniref:ATP-dependent Clp protease adapter protein ClpS n=2 Tax=Leptospira interrogans TaxID=173 RepID=A0A0F6I7V8_LEPIR|nr:MULTISPECIES: ATP-dependent Clp protease adapter ClpS [Leptospira]EMN47566.1 ATP-dependent Clp protease adaptor protein ClpS [Leptospira interrogans str. L1207]KAA1289232.1 ATP-dependent Clp protease adaptor ClpS [Leptospira interrogans serovar Geyaweera]AJR14541.1 ATP-dependent Clp protease adaptor protein ClpS [Leptospira interrogans serovar Linhai str. 56609]ASV05895.1 ATP-dependent Clp protease adaptor ClpS [Leptospira interrogans serovar Canicola]ASV08142.1 ATP-dependent Clp protease a